MTTLMSMGIGILVEQKQKDKEVVNRIVGIEVKK